MEQHGRKQRDREEKKVDLRACVYVSEGHISPTSSFQVFSLPNSELPVDLIESFAFWNGFIAAQGLVCPPPHHPRVAAPLVPAAPVATGAAAIASHPRSRSTDATVTHSCDTLTEK